MEKSIFLILTIVLMITLQEGFGQTCPPFSSPVYDKMDDIIITTYHSHIALGDGYFLTWGEDMDSDGTDATVLTQVTPSNNYNYTGTPLMFCVSGNSGAQAFLLTTDGMYSWGSTSEVVGGSIVSSSSFSTMTMPTGVTPADVFDIKANSDIFFLVTNTGEVWVAGQIATHVSGNAVSGSNTWHQVEISAGVPLTGVVDISGNREAVYALKSDDSMVTWGRGVALGGGTSAQDLIYATTMDLSAIPSGVNLLQLGIYMDNGDNSSGLLALGTDGKVYGIGYSGARQMINESTGFVSDWLTIKDSGGTDISDVVFLSTTENSEEYAAASIITTVPSATNNLYTWGYNDDGSIGHGGSQITLEYPTIPLGFSVGTHNPVYTSVGGHATSFINNVDGGKICFTGHITNGSGGGLQTGADQFSCFGTGDAGWPAGIELCNQAALAQADISLTKTVNNANPSVGDTIIFTIVAENIGGTDATGVEVTDLLPTEFSHVQNDSGGDYVVGSGLWSIGNLAISNSTTLNITVIADQEGMFTNTATVTNLNETDGNAGNDSDSASVTVVCPVPLAAPAIFRQ